MKLISYTYKPKTLLLNYITIALLSKKKYIKIPTHVENEKAYSCANAAMRIKYCLKWNGISRTTFKSRLLKRNLHYK